MRREQRIPKRKRLIPDIYHDEMGNVLITKPGKGMRRVMKTRGKDQW